MLLIVEKIATYSKCDLNKSRSYSNNSTLHSDESNEEPHFPTDETSISPSFHVNNTSVFNEIDLNTGAKGLFHPASTIEAFTDHDAKHHQGLQRKLPSGPRRARSGTEFPPSRESHQLPALRNEKTDHNRQLALPESKLQRSSHNGSAPASMTTVSSLSNLEDAHKRKQSLSATRSDSYLYAPRGLIAASAGNALTEDDDDKNTNNQSDSDISLAIQAHEILDDDSSIVPPLNISLATKFEKLKQILKSNRKKQNSARKSGDKSHSGGPGVEKPKIPLKSRVSRRDEENSFCDSSRSSPSCRNGKTSASNVGVSKTRLIIAAGNKKSGLKYVVPKGKTRTIANDMNMKNAGTSLSDLKAEHREALKMLQELGGPIDPDYLQTNSQPDVSKNGQSSKPRRFGSQYGKKKTNHPSPSTSPTLGKATKSVVTKLRESVPSSCTLQVGDSAQIASSLSKHGNSECEINNMVPVSDQLLLKKTSLDDGKSTGALRPPSLLPNNDIWKQYENDTVSGDEKGNNESECNDRSEAKEAIPSESCYNDEDFESDC